MKSILTGNEMKSIDKNTIENIGIPGIVLMERAALSVANFIEEKEKKDRTVLVVAGVGNNGADGLAVCRMLHLLGYSTCIYILGDKDKGTEDFKTQLNIVKNLGIEISDSPIEADVIVDAIFGVGLSRDVTGHYKEVIDYINSARAHKYAVDIPSGVDASSGKVLGCAVNADYTVTFGYEKVGTVLYPGAQYCGKVTVADIGFAKSDVLNYAIKYIEKEDLHFVPKRQNYSNKGTYGKILVIAGSKDISGAAVLSALAAFKTGAGMVRVFTHENNRNVIAKLIPEAMINTYTIDEFDEKALDACLNWSDVVAIGPGIGTGEVQSLMVEKTLESGHPCVLDADGINTIARHEDIKKKFHKNVIITPHLKELSRFEAISIDDILKDIVKRAEEVNYKHNVSVVLKDARSVIATENATYINLSGNSGMATAGSGDVLTGILAGLIGIGTDLNLVPALGAYIHGLAGDIAAMHISKESMMATDIIRYIPDALKGEIK